MREAADCCNLRRNSSVVELSNRPGCQHGRLHQQSPLKPSSTARCAIWSQDGTRCFYMHFWMQRLYADAKVRVTAAAATFQVIP